MSHRPAKRTRILAAGPVFATALSLLHAGCGGDGGAPAAPPAPPPPQPLGWSNLPGEITVQVAETATFTATLTAAVDATYTISANSEAVEVSGEAVRAGVFQGSVTGVEAGEAEITVTASHTGYVTATDSLDVIVEDPFDQALWRELVFDAFDCPNGFTDESCRNFWGERNVEDRITAVLSVPAQLPCGEFVQGVAIHFVRHKNDRRCDPRFHRTDHRGDVHWPDHEWKRPTG